MADSYDTLAKRLGLPIASIPNWRAAAGAPAAPSYEGVTLQGMMPPAPAPAGPPPPPAPSYEGATLQGMAPTASGLSLADPPKAAAPPKMRLATGDNVSTAPAAVKPNVMAQMQQVANNSDATKGHVKTALDEDERKKNLEGATFAGGAAGGVANPYGGAPVMVDKGGRRAQSWQINEGLDLGTQASEAVGSADERNRAAAGLDFMAGQKAADFERGYLERHAKASEKFAAEESARTQKYAEQVDSHMAKLDDLRAQIREAQVDPFGGMNAGVARIGQAIAIGLGAFASKRGENMGLDAVKHTIATNLGKQEEDLKKLERGAKGEMNFLGQLKQQYGDVGVAREAARIAYLEQAKVELAKNLGDPEVADPRLLAGYERLQAKLDDELVNRTAHFKAITEDRVVRHDVNAQPKYIGGAGIGKEARGDAKWLSEKYEAAGVPAALANLEGVDQMIDTFGDGDIPGIGPIVGKVPDWLMPDRAVAGRQAVAAVKNRVRKSIAGASLTDGEKVELNKELEGAGDAGSLRRALQNVRRSLHHQQRNIAAGASPEGNMLYNLQGGSVKSVPLDKPTTPYVREAK
ncbi:MAG: hypothetical protein KF795_17830 [Labilithrix sp.]|nr:hypothetical protein [Labilithrix sp.]